MRFDITNSCLSDSFMNNLVSTEDSVSEALRQSVDKVIYQGHLRIKEFEHMKVLRLALYRQFLWLLRGSPLEQFLVFGPKHYGSAFSLSDWRALRER